MEHDSATHTAPKRQVIQQPHQDDFDLFDYEIPSNVEDTYQCILYKNLCLHRQSQAELVSEVFVVFSGTVRRIQLTNKRNQCRESEKLLGIQIQLSNYQRRLVGWKL
jgi:hypothetical protein